jgi:nucleoside diphosphate kinase
MPSDLRERYEEFAADPARLSLEKEMAVTRAMISERIQAMEAINSSEAWNRLNKLYTDMTYAQNQKQVERYARLFNELGDVIAEGVGIESTRKETIRLIEQERKLVDSQRQLYIDMGEFITRGMALAMLTNFLEAVKENVTPLEGGTKALTVISTTIRGMAGALGGRQPERRSPKVIDGTSRMAD